MPECEYKLKQKITIIPLDIEGIINAIFFSESGLQYRVRYFWNGEAKDTYLYEWEIK